MKKEEFILKAREVHGWKYDYSKVEYKNNRTPVCIICSEHGEFWQTPSSHLQGRGCKKCGLIKVGNRLKSTKEEFIKKAKEIHGDKYDYSKVEYNGNKTKVCIICPEHGEFYMTPTNHCSTHNKCGCPKCSKYKKLTTEEFIKKAKEIHGNKYDYSKVEYVNNQKKVYITCPEHGEFWQTPNDHLNGRGCRKCGENKLKNMFSRTTEEFIEKAKEIHGDKYDYSKVEYDNCKKKVCIICHKHGEFWQTPDVHLRGRGCPICNQIHLSVDKLAQLLKNNNIIFEREKTFKWLGRQRLDFYLPKYNIAIEYQGEQHFKPVKYFGGEKKYLDRIERDNRKKTLCKENNINILYFSYWEKAPSNIIKDENELIKIFKNENI